MVNMCRAQLLRLFGVTLLLLSALVASTMAVEEATSVRHRRSGISDQRLAELETLYALSSMRGKPGTHSVAYGLIDPARIGKRKRSFYASKPDDVNRKSKMNFLLQVLRRLKALQPDENADTRNNHNTVEVGQ